MTTPSRSDAPRVTTIAVTSGKGGVGKTSVAINLAVGLAKLRHRVAILDADFALGNVDVLLGLAPASHLGQVLAGERRITDILVPGPQGIRIIPASSGPRQLASLTERQWDRLYEALDDLEGRFDYLIIDTAAGISDNVMEALRIAGQVLVVASIEPTSVVDAYAVIKLLSAGEPQRNVGLVVNNVRDAAEARQVFGQLEIAVRRFLNRPLADYGFIAYDPAVREAILVRRPVVDHQPDSSASRCFRSLALRLSAMGPLRGPGLRLVRPAHESGGPAAEETPRCA
jgi:flagellar biosynthesis protein FlhG